jgi:predicted DNA-binding transcriptional regulator AlpA
MPQSSSPTKLLTLDEVAEFFRIPPATLYSQRYRGVNPGALGIRIGRHLRFRSQDIDQWLVERSSGVRR